MYKLAIIAIATVMLIPLVTSSFASNIEIDIHTGSADQNQHLTFYPPQSSAFVGDTIMIGNGDTVPHEVVSGTPSTGPDGKFDSGTLNPGQYFSYTLTGNDVGSLNFYDKQYQWMTGTVVVGTAPAGYKVLHNVGADAGNGKTTFDVQYQSVKDIISSSINPKDKSVNFVLVGQSDQNSTLVLRLPTGLIDGPFLGVWIDNQMTKNYTMSPDQGVNVFTIPISAKTEGVSIVGGHVVPEFGPVAGVVLIVSIIGIVLFARIRPTHKLG